MAAIMECNVTVPPTAAGVRERVSAAIEKRALLPLTLLSQQEVPKAEPFDIEVDIMRTNHPEYGTVGETVIEGWRVNTENTSSKTVVVLRIPASPDEAATASLVIE